MDYSTFDYKAMTDDLMGLIKKHSIRHGIFVLLYGNEKLQIAITPGCSNHPGMAVILQTLTTITGDIARMDGMVNVHPDTGQVKKSPDPEKN